MSTVLWRGDAPAVAQVNTLTVGSVSSGIVYTITINGKSIGYTTGGGDTATTVAAALLALLIAQGAPPEFKEITWSNPGAGVLVATAVYPGTPFTLAAAATSTGTFTGSTPSTASSGPADASVGANYSTGGLPGNGDDLVFSASANSCVFGLSALSALTLNSLSIDQSFTGKIGLARNNPAGYVEYRPQYLQVGATTITIGNGPGNGSGRIKIDNLAVQTTVNVFNSGQASDPGVKTILWKGTHAANVVNISKGSFAAGYLEGDSATIATLRQGFQTNQNGDVDCLLGPGCTLSTINKTGGGAGHQQQLHHAQPGARQGRHDRHHRRNAGHDDHHRRVAHLPHGRRLHRADRGRQRHRRLQPGSAGPHRHEHHAERRRHAARPGPEHHVHRPDRRHLPPGRRDARPGGFVQLAAVVGAR